MSEKEDSRTIRAVHALTYAAGMPPSEERAALLLGAALLYAAGVLAEYGLEYTAAVGTLAKRAVLHAEFAENAQKRDTKN